MVVSGSVLEQVPLVKYQCNTIRRFLDHQKDQDLLEQPQNEINSETNRQPDEQISGPSQTPRSAGRSFHFRELLQLFLRDPHRTRLKTASTISRRTKRYAQSSTKGIGIREVVPASRLKKASLS